MIIVMDQNAEKADHMNVKSIIKSAGLKPKSEPGIAQTTICVIGIIDKQKMDELQEKISAQTGVKEVMRISSPYKIASRDFAKAKKVIVTRDSGDKKVQVEFNGRDIVIIAGPCAVESEDQMRKIAKFLSNLGVKLLRGGAYKPRSSPYAFQGLREEGLRIAREVTDEYGMLFITELTDTANTELVSKYADIIQIGARNMYNYDLLKEAGKINKPVMLKRGMSATVEELLLAAEYVLSEQPNPQVILCLRGIRTFETNMRNTPDLGSIPFLNQNTWLPVVVDPSHATGSRNLILPISLMAIAGGACGVMVEVHNNPEEALCDGKQSLHFSEFLTLYNGICKTGEALQKKLA